MLVSATDFKSNLGHYLAIVANEDIFITKNGKSIAKLSTTKRDKVDIMRSLFGIIKDSEITLEQAKEERLSRYEIND
jgi:prevent-host-death family protein